MGTVLGLVCVLTFAHYVGAQMRGPILSLYAADHGATATGVGMIMGAHMAAAAIGSIPLGRISDVWGRRRLMRAGMAVGVATSLLLPAVENQWALTAISGLAGVGVAAFTPSALSLVGDAAPPGRAGHAYAWYSTAHYGAIGIGPFLGGIIAERFGYRAAFVVSAIGIAVALAAGRALPSHSTASARSASGAAFAQIKGNAHVWAGWIVSLGGLLVQGVVFSFFPLLARDQGLGPAGIGFVLLVLGLANTAVRIPAGWLVDRTGRSFMYATGGVLVASAVTAVLPHVRGHTLLLGLIATFGAASGLAFVAVSAGLATASSPATRGLVMGGYSTSLYLGFALGAFTLGPVIARYGYEVGFAAGAVMSVIGTLAAVVLGAADGAATGGQPPARSSDARPRSR